MDELESWLRLAHSHGVGPTTINALLDHLKHPQAILTAGIATLRNCGVSTARITALHKARNCPQLSALVEKTADWLQCPVNQIIHQHDSRYPALLNQLPDAPTLLYASGDSDILSTPAVAIVGSRKSAPPALTVTRRLAGDLASRGITITSGLAKGVDRAAHQAALNVNGLTISVAGTGLDRVYPASHRELAEDIAEAGILISEFPLGSGPLAHHFPRRNRIISGLSLGVVIIEAGLKSGTLITARHAIEQGREVMVVPGSINNPLAQGAHELIRSGATLVRSAEDILTEIGPQIDTDPRITSGSPPHSTAMALPCGGCNGPEPAVLLDSLGYEPATVDTLIERSGYSASVVMTVLLQLELEGRIASLSGGRYARC